MGNIKQKISIVHSCAEVAENIFLVRFVSQEIAALALPGNFVNILTAETGMGPLLRRPFSISNIEGDIISLIFQKIGIGTILLSRKRPGDVIDVLGPLGRPYHVNEDFDIALIVAGGIGMAPLPFLSEYLQKQGKSVETFIGFRNSSQIYTSTLQDVHISTDDGSKGFNGNVVQMLKSFLDRKNIGRVKIFGCGPTAMLRNLSELADSMNICCEVSLEGKMACGIGICQGCPVELKGDDKRYALVCKDGPTFLTTEIKI